MSAKWIRIRLFVLLAVLIVLFATSKPGRWVLRTLFPRRTVADVMRRYGPLAQARMNPYFQKARVRYPPRRVALLAFKHERQLEIWAPKDGVWVHVRSYPILGASGEPGPKLREGDRQVPEGIYRVIALNPNSHHYLSMKLDYPNEYDREKARPDRRSKLGSDIFLHGGSGSVGCIAIGDRAIEELFVLTARVGRSNVKVLIAPNDLRRERPVPDVQSGPPWLPEL